MDKNLEKFRRKAKEWMNDRAMLESGSLEPLIASPEQHLENAALIQQVWAMACAFIAENTEEYIRYHEYGRLGRRGRAIAAEFYGFADGVISDALRPKGNAKHPEGASRFKKSRDRLVMSSIAIMKSYQIRGVYRQLSQILKQNGIEQAESSIKKRWLSSSNAAVRLRLPHIDVTDELLRRFTNFVFENHNSGKKIAAHDVLEFLGNFWRQASQELPKRVKG